MSKNSWGKKGAIPLATWLVPWSHFPPATSSTIILSLWDLRCYHTMVQHRCGLWRGLRSCASCYSPALSVLTSPLYYINCISLWGTLFFLQLYVSIGACFNFCNKVDDMMVEWTLVGSLTNQTKTMRTPLLLKEAWNWHLSYFFCCLSKKELFLRMAAISVFFLFSSLDIARFTQ